MNATQKMASSTILILNLIFLFSCGGSKEGKEYKTDHVVRGADISWLPQMEAGGYIFRNDDGVPEDCFKILKDHGMTAVRLRTFVNPSDHPQSGHCSKNETVAMALRAKKWGMQVMINFHYSDSWADPSKQRKPKAWENFDFPSLLQAMYAYTHEVMVSLDSAGIQPEWAQVGNEIPGGMLYPEGSVENWPQLAQLINQGYDAIKHVSPETQVILHIDKGNDNDRFRWWFDAANTYGAKYDIIGLSYYPYWQEGQPDYTLSIDNLGNNLNDLIARYNKEVMVVEVGGIDTAVQNTYNMLVAVIQKVLEVPEKKGLGVFYWEPQGARSWSRYPLSAWGDDQRPTKALDAFLFEF